MSKSIKEALKEIGKLLNDNIKEKVYYFNSISDMKSSTKLKSGDMVITKGYYESNDGGSGEYEIVDNRTLVDDGGSVHDLNNGLKAKLRMKTGEVNVRQFGAKGDGVTDDTNYLILCFKKAMEDLCIDNIEINTGNFILNSALDISKKINIYCKGKLINGTNDFITLNFKENSDYSCVYNIKIDGNMNNKTNKSEVNDEIRINPNVSNITVQGGCIENSGGNGIQCRGHHCLFENININNSYCNGIIIGDEGASYNKVLNCKIYGTVRQNAIFITASPGSHAVSHWIKGNSVLNCIVDNFGDTGIESGIHTKYTIIDGCYCGIGSNPPLLVRDAMYVNISNCTCEGDIVAHPNTSGIAVVFQTDNIDNTYHKCTKNKLTGYKNGVYLNSGGSNTIDNNVIFECNTGIYVQKDNNKIINNNINNCEKAVTFNPNASDTPINCSMINNNITNCTQGYIYYKKKNIKNHFYSMNTFNNVTTPFHIVESTFFNCFGNNNFNNGEFLNLPVEFDRVINHKEGESVPLKQYDSLALSPIGYVGLMSLYFGDEFALLYIYPESSTDVEEDKKKGFTILKSSQNIYGDLSGYAGWAIYKSPYGFISIQRRGETLTDNIYYKLNLFNVH